MSRGRQFLIVEDNRGVARTVARALRNHSTTIATSAREAIRFLDEHAVAPPPLILDVKLPDGTGFEVLEHARLRGPFVDALVMSGDVSFVNRAFESDVQFVQKPVASELIAAFAARVDERSRARNTRLIRVLNQWTARYPLTPAERASLYAAAIDGVSRTHIPEHLGKSNETIKTQINSLLEKTGHQTLLEVVVELLRAAMV